MSSGTASLSNQAPSSSFTVPFTTAGGTALTREGEGGQAGGTTLLGTLQQPDNPEAGRAGHSLPAVTNTLAQLAQHTCFTGAWQVSCLLAGYLTLGRDFLTNTGAHLSHQVHAKQGDTR